MARLSKALFFYGMMIGLLGVPVALLGLIVRAITGSWTVSHVGLCMMGGGFVAFVIGIWVMSFVAQNDHSRPRSIRASAAAI